MLKSRFIFLSTLFFSGLGACTTESHIPNYLKNESQVYHEPLDSLNGNPESTNRWYMTKGNDYDHFLYQGNWDEGEGLQKRPKNNFINNLSLALKIGGFGNSAHFSAAH